MTTTAEIVENLLIYFDSVDNAAATLRNNLKKLVKQETSEPQFQTVSEKLFTDLTWRDEKGPQLLEYQISLDSQNETDPWNKAYKTLETKGAVINKRFHPEGYVYAYWIYDQMPYKIFRQQLKVPKQ